MALSPNEELFHQASRDGDLSKMKNILKKFINSKGGKGRTPLHNALENGYTSMTNFLISNGAEVNIQDENGQTPLYIASRNGCLESVKHLIENGATIDAKRDNGTTPLYIASQNGHFESVKCLIENGATVDAKNNEGYTPLIIASLMGHLESVKCLIENGAFVDAKNDHGARANVNEKCMKGKFTPLHIAAQQDKLEVVKFLVENGAFIDVQDKDGETPLYIAIKNEHHDIANYLSEAKARVENEFPKKTYTNKDPCIICMKPRNQLYVLLPCGHTSLCEPCCIKLKCEPNSKCPSCRKVIKSYQKIFFQ